MSYATLIGRPAMSASDVKVDASDEREQRTTNRGREKCKDKAVGRHEEHQRS